MKAWKIRQYLPALLLYMQRRVEGGRGAVISIRTRDVCGVDRRCGAAVHSLMMRLVERGLAKRHKRSTYMWYERVRVGVGVNLYDVFCGPTVNGVKLYQPHCRSVDDCVRQIVEDYKREVEKMREPPQPALVINYDPAEELLRGGLSWRRLARSGL
jgi:hypothetical protein